MSRDPALCASNSVLAWLPRLHFATIGRARPASLGSVGRTPDHGLVPRISAFYGIVIAMYYRDHAPPHFHAIYGEHEATVVIATLEVLSGSLPARAFRLVREWAEIHAEELTTNWQRARQHEKLDSIEPLT